MRELSRRLVRLPASATVAVNDKAKAMRAAGHDVIALAGGDPDFATPQHIVQAAYAAILAGKTHYPSPTKGITRLLEAIAGKMDHDHGFHVRAESDIVVTPGSKWALNLALASVVNPGDEVIYLEPVWVTYPPIIRLHGGEPVPVQLSADDDFAITREALRAKVTPRSKALMVNSPNNPTGRVLTRDEVDAIVAVAVEADLFVISDEVYEKLIYDGREHYCLAAEPGMAGRTLTVNGLSKGYAMTGWRLGWLIGPTPVMKLAAKMNGQTVTSAAAFTMEAAVAALTGPQEIVEEMRLSYVARRDFMVPALNEIEGITCAMPEGAFYLMPRFTQSDKNSLQLANVLLEEAGIAATPGVAFGVSGEGHLRFSIATAMSELERAVERLAQFAPTL
jgi:aspartate aminotransferase